MLSMLTAILLTACSPSTPKTLDALLADEIGRSGAKAALQRLTAEGLESARWKELASQIEKGGDGYVRVAASLLQASDAGVSESLLFSLSIALTNNAEPVIAVLGPEIPAAKLCIVRHIEPDEETVRRHKERARAALARVTRPELAGAKEACLAQLAR